MTAAEQSCAPPGFTVADDRHARMVALDAGGLPTTVIAQMLGLTPDTVAAIQRSPLYAAQKRRVVEAMSGAVPDREDKDTLRGLMGTLARGQLPAGADVDRVSASVMLGAAKELLDREDPKVHKTSEDRTVRVLIPPEVADRLAAAARALTATRTLTLPGPSPDAIALEPFQDFIANAPEHIPPPPSEP